MSEFEELFGEEQAEPAEVAPPVIKTQPKIAPVKTQAVAPKKYADKLKTKSEQDEIDDIFGGVDLSVTEPLDEKKQEEKSFFANVVTGIANTFVDASRAATVLKRQVMGQPISDIPVPSTNDPSAPLSQVMTTGILKYAPTSMAGTYGGAALGAFGGPFAPVTIPLGGIVGGMLGSAVVSFLDDPRSENLADVIKKNDDAIKESIKGTPFEDADVLVDAIAEHGREDVTSETDLGQRFTNAVTDIYTGAIIAPVSLGVEVAAKRIFGKTASIVKEVAKKTNLPESEVIKNSTKPEVAQAIKEETEKAAGVVNKQLDAATKFEESLPPSQVEPGTPAKPKPDVPPVPPKEAPASEMGDMPPWVDPKVEKQLDEALPEQIKVTKTESETIFDVPPDVKIDPTDETVTSRLGSILRTSIEKYKEMREFSPVVFKEMIEKAKGTITQADKARILKEGISNDLDDMPKLLVMFEEAGTEYDNLVKTLDVTDSLSAAKALEAERAVFDLASIWVDAGTEQGRVLGFRRMLSQVAAAGGQVEQELIGTAGKIKTIDGVLAKQGGVEDIAKRVEMTRLLFETSDFEATAKSLGITNKEALKKLKQAVTAQAKDFAMDKMGEVYQRTTAQKVGDALTTSVMNNLLTVWTPFNVAISTISELGLKSSANFVKAAGFAAINDRVAARAAAYEATVYYKTLFQEWGTAATAAKNAYFNPNKSASKVVYGYEGVSDIAKQIKAAQSPEHQARWGAFYDMFATGAGLTIDQGRKLLVSSEAFFSHIGSRAHTRSKMTAIGSKQGLRGEALDNFVNNGPTPQWLIDEAIYKGQELAQANLPKLTINREIEKFINKVPMVKFFNLFYRATANSAERMMEYTPILGFAVRDATEKTTEELSETLAKQATGTIFLSFAYAGYENGVISKKPVKGQSDVKYLNPNDVDRTSGGQFAYQINTPFGAVNAPQGSVLDKLLRLGEAAHTFADAVEDDEASAFVDAGGALLGNLMGGGSAYQSDFEFLINLINGGETTEESFKRFLESNIVKVSPLEPTLRKVDKMIDSENYFLDKRPDPTEGLIEHVTNRLYNIYNDRGFAARRNIFGEKLYAPQGFAGLSVFTTPTDKTSRSLEMLRGIEEMGINKSSQGFQAPSFELPSRNIDINMFVDNYSADIEEVAPSVPLPRPLYEMMLDFYAEGAGGTGSLRGDLEDQMDAMETMLTPGTSPLDFNIMLGNSINATLSQARTMAKERLKMTPEYQEWEQKISLDIQSARSKVFKEDLEKINKKSRINLQIR